MAAAFADKIDMQNRLFAALSAMFGKEVPLYDKSLLVNEICNTTACELLAKLHPGFAMSAEQLEKTSGERHGAIRIGRPDEYRWIARFFACFAMQPHNFYDMSAVGSKSQPIFATAFRSVLHPEHRVFSSLLLTDLFDDAVKARIERVLGGRQVFSDRAKELIEKSERQGGLDHNDADALIREGTERIFKWTGKARDFGLYKELCDAGFKIAADIACFERHHLNHLTPNTFCMDLYTAAMKKCFGEIDEAEFAARATRALERLAQVGGRDFMRLTFKHLSYEQIDAFGVGTVDGAWIKNAVDALTKRLGQADTDLTAKAGVKHAGFKDFTEGPAEDTPVFLRQDAYKALTEPVEFTNPDGSVTNASHTARFGEIEQRTYACTPKGRKLYDQCLAAAEAERDQDPGLVKRDYAAYEKAYAKHFSPIAKALGELIDAELVYAKFLPTSKGLSAKGSIATANLRELIAQGLVAFDGLRYEDFLPVSAAGIFASNLNQYGTAFTAKTRKTYVQADLEAIMGKPIIDADRVYRGVQAASIVDTLTKLGVIGKVAPGELEALRADAAYVESLERGASATNAARVPAGV